MYRIQNHRRPAISLPDGWRRRHWGHTRLAVPSHRRTLLGEQEEVFLVGTTVQNGRRLYPALLRPTQSQSEAAKRCKQVQSAKALRAYHAGRTTYLPVASAQFTYTTTTITAVSNPRHTQRRLFTSPLVQTYLVCAQRNGHNVGNLVIGLHRADGTKLLRHAP